MSNTYPYAYEICTDMDRRGETNERESLEGFSPLLYLTEAVGILLIVLVGVWTFEFRGGLAWSSNPALQFNWHPLLMTIGFVFLFANGILIYRSQRTVRKRRLKLIHAGTMIFALLLSLVGSVAVFEFHNALNIPNLYSLHSWVGLTSVILYLCQWLAGFVSFLYPMIQQPLRAAYLPIHVYFGAAAFVGSVASCLLGLTEKAIFSLTNPTAANPTSVPYSKLPPEGILINVIGLVFVVFGGLTIYLVSQERYRRLPRPEDDLLLSRRN
ncbi:hypothetical protein QAD02_016146 [Eretmocerus hayati]|uniref:Uncharacterized protein n=1 Tax=Eretmocerus hayati TaxID=131215 RepID=A0ACC2PCP2_9HYME|nr:hypothetical protein QAD02_016146 [Eretmocerus hayati]